MQELTDENLRDVLTPDEPLGPRASEDILTHLDLFSELYQSKADLNDSLHPGLPAYVVGRKGAGKTAFLIGEGLESRSHVIAVRAAHAFSVVDSLRWEWENGRGSLPTDNLAHIWETILVHAGMRGLVNRGYPGDGPYLTRIANYLASINPDGAERDGRRDVRDSGEDNFLASVGAAALVAMRKHPPMTPIREVMSGIGAANITFATARDIFEQMLSRPGRAKLCVVVDNLEDLHSRVTGLEPVLAGLFRITSRVGDVVDPIRLPFELRFAFPAELMAKLRTITANPDKDFRNDIVIEWTASELIDLISIRLRRSLDLYFGREDVEAFLAHSPDDSVIRAILPSPTLTNGLGQAEDPVAYIMRHTQLLPRHLIQIMNQVLSPMIKQRILRRVSEREVLRGVKKAESTIAQGVLSSYLYDFPELGECLSRLRNNIAFTSTQAEIRKAYTRLGVRRHTGERFSDFLWAAMSSGVLGIERRRTERYVVSYFSYTFQGSLQPLDNDRLCLHPLFVHLIHDIHSLEQLRQDGHLPIYPYGSGTTGLDQ